MEKRKIIILSLLLVITLTNFFRISSTVSIKNIHFVSVFAIGLLTGMLIFSIIAHLKQK